jgi:hypothetical protein
MILRRLLSRRTRARFLAFIVACSSSPRIPHVEETDQGAARKMIQDAAGRRQRMPELKRLGVADGQRQHSPRPRLGSGGAASAAGAALEGLAT